MNRILVKYGEKESSGSVETFLKGVERVSNFVRILCEVKCSINMAMVDQMARLTVLEMINKTPTIIAVFLCVFIACLLLP